MNVHPAVPRVEIRKAKPDAVRIGLRQLTAALRRRKILILAVTLAGAVLSLLSAQQRGLTFTAGSTVVLQSESLPMQDIFERLRGLEINRSMVETQMDVLQSRQLLGTVVDHLELTRDPHFNPALHEPSRPVLMQIAEALSLGDLVRERAAERKAELARQSADPLVFQGVEATVSSLATPAVAVNVTQIVPEHDPVVDHPGGFVPVMDWLDDWLVELVEEDAASSVTASPEEQRDLVITRLSHRVSIERSGESLALWIYARAPNPELAAAIANTLAKVYIERRVRTRRQELETATEILRQRVSDLAGKLADTEQEIAWHVREARLDDLDYDAKLRAEITQLQARFSIAPRETEEQRRAKERLESSISVLEDELMERTLAVIRRQKLERELETDRIRHLQMTERLADLDTETNALRPGADIVSTADPPLRPSSMEPVTASVLGGIGSFFIGSMIVFFMAAFDTRIRTAPQLEEHLDIPCLSAVPELKRRHLFRLRSAPPHQYLLANPRSAFAEALRRTCLKLIDTINVDGARTLAVTSSLPDEGKTTLAVCLGVTAASLGNRVAVVDLDLRRTGVAALVSEAEDAYRKPGLSEWFLGRLPLEQAFFRLKGKSGTDIYASAVLSGDLDDYMTEEKLGELFGYLKQRYDVIIVDTPPIMLVSDIILLKPFIDGALIIVGWEHVEERSLDELRETLVLSSVKTLGAVLNRVDTKKQLRSGVSDRHSAAYLYDDGYYGAGGGHQRAAHQ